MYSSKFYPPEESCDVPVEIRMLTVLGDFIGGEEYRIFLHIRENKFPGTTSGQQQLHIKAESESK